jgi:integrase
MSEPTKTVTVRVMVRHSQNCKDRRKGTDWRRCNCRKALYVYDNGNERFVSAKTRSWTQAETRAQEMRDSLDPVKQELARLKEEKVRTETHIEETLRLYYDDLRGQKKTDSHIDNVRALFGVRDTSSGKLFGNLLKWLDRLNAGKREDQRIVNIGQLNTFIVTQWRASWKYNDLTAATRWSMVKSFFTWCLHQGLIERHPCANLKANQVRKGNRCGAFTKSQYRDILAACDNYLPDNVPPQTKAALPQRMRALTELMRWGGLALVDATLWTPASVDKTGVMRYRRYKTEELAIVPLPSHVSELLSEIPLEPDSVGPNQPFRTKNVDVQSDCARWRRRFGHVFEIAGITEVVTEIGEQIEPHPHMFRDTMAIWYLERGHAVPDVAKMLGHAKTATTEKSYSFWIRSREDAMVERVRKDQAELVPVQPGKVVNIQAARAMVSGTQ